MSAFNDYLRRLIKKRNISISELARMTQIERTALQKSLTGDRVLPYDSVKTLSSFLQLTLSEKKKLLHYYNELFESEDVRESRKIIAPASSPTNIFRVFVLFFGFIINRILSSAAFPCLVSVVNAKEGNPASCMFSRSIFA